MKLIETLKRISLPLVTLALANGARGAGELKRWLFFAGVFGCAMFNLIGGNYDLAALRFAKAAIKESMRLRHE